VSIHLLRQNLTVAVALAAHASEPATFVRAYLEEAEVCFDSEAPIDWAELAQEHFTLFAPATPSREALAAHWNEVSREATFTYDAPLPAGYPSSGYTLIAESGLQSLRLTHLRGEIRYDLRDLAATPEPPLFGGRVCGSPASPVADAAFVAVGSTRLRQVRHGLPSGNSLLPSSEAGFDPVKSAYTFKDMATGRSFLFVRRAPDDTCRGLCCTFSYDLYAQPTLSLVLHNAYLCDL
jgi:hypothetical protein